MIITQNSTLKSDFKRRVYIFTLDLIKFIDKTPKNLSSEIICKQLLRSGTSIDANHIEAQAASPRKDFSNFLNHSLKSANETLFWLSVLKDTNKTDNKVT